MKTPAIETSGRVKDVFLGARDVSAMERPDYLAAHCGEDVYLRARVEALLAADENAGRFLSSPTGGQFAPAALTDETEFDLLQRTLSGRYSLEREIGRGGMGVVYLARDVALNRAVAVKLLPVDVANRPGYRARFLREVRTAAGMTHPNIVPIHSVEEHGDVVCFVMSYVDGESLRQWVERNGPLSQGDAARVMQEVAWALAHAHDRGIVHRDVKPDNILIERDTRRALVTDFGIAGTLEAGASQTMDGVFLGTPLFASPEQAAQRSIDGRSDVYSLGATIFFALTGRPVFETSSAMAALARHLTEPPPRIGALRSDLPRVLAEGVDRCLAKDPDGRFQSAEELARELGAVVSSTTELPESIRRVVREITHLTGDVAGWGLFGLAAASGWVLAWRTSGGFLLALITVVLQLSLLTGVAFLVIRSGEALAEAREALRKGFTQTRIRGALPGLTGPMNQRAVVRSRLPGLTLGVVTVLTGFAWFSTWGGSPWSSTPWGKRLDVLVETFGMFGPFLVGRLAFRGALTGEIRGLGWLRRTHSWIGGLVLRVAAWRLPRDCAPPVASDPTEALLVDAADSLLAQLPTAFRESLSDVPELVHRLERHADALRTRRAELERALAEAGISASRHESRPSEGSASDLLRARSESARAELVQAHQSAGARLADVIVALESVRLGLLRLRAGVATPADLTTDLGLASQVRQQLDALLLGSAEVASLTNGIASAKSGIRASSAVTQRPDNGLSIS